MKLYLDDVRPAPPGWIPVRNAADFQAVMRSHEWDEVSLDHDLGVASTLGLPTTEVTGYDLVRWMFREGHLPKTKPIVHSANPVGAKRMRDYIEAAWSQKDDLTDPDYGF